MSLTIPDWVAHMSVDSEDKDKKKQTTIFSLSVHPDGSRLATGGIDQKIRIWTTEPILDAGAESGAHKLLSTLSRHTGSVVSVRFSPSGRFLASGSDDQVCFIWEYDPNGTSMGSFGSSEQNVESWKIHRRLTGHESDVVDIAWSADEHDSYLATVGLDAVINIWSGPAQLGDDPRTGFERVRRIAGHDGFVKGVVWDPRGNYLATQSDDKTLKIWRTSDWSCAKVVKEPFQSSPSSNFFGRPSWSPDGGYIIAANAMSGPIFVASIIERKTWSTDLKLVGHEDSVVVCAFSPRLFHMHGTPLNSRFATIAAIGSRDQSISIWMTGTDKPLLVLKDVFDRQVTDLAWAPDGLTLYASSTAGSVAAIVLDISHIAEPLPASRSYAAKPQIQSGVRASALVPVSVGGTTQRPNILQPRKAGPAIQPARANIQPVHALHSASTGSALPPPASAKAGAQRLTQQIQVLPNGKRRIRPTLIGGDGSAGSLSSSLAIAPDNRMDVDRLEASSGITSSMVISPAQQPVSSFTTQQPQQQPAQPQVQAPPSQQQQLQLFQQYQQFLQFQQMQQSLGSQSLLKSDDATSPISVPATYQPDQSFDAALAAARTGKGRGRENRILGSDLPREATVSGMQVRPGEDGDFFSKGLPRALSLPPVMGTLRREGEAGGIVEVRNYDGSRPVEIVVSDTEGANAKVQWMDFLSSYVLRCALSVAYLTIAQSDGQILVYTSKGRRISTMALDSPVCLMECRGAVLMAITNAGFLHRWNLQGDRELHRPISCLSLLTGPDDIHSIVLHSNGCPVLILKTEQAWAVDTNKNAWVLIASGWYADSSPLWDGRGRGRGGAGSSGSASGNDATASGGFTTVGDSGGRWREPMKAIESEINSLVVARGETGARAASRPPAEDSARTKDFTLATSLRHLEMRMQGAILLSSKDEYLLHLRAYVRLISDEGLKGLGEEVIREFLGPIYYYPSVTDSGGVGGGSQSGSKQWEPTVFDVPKRTLCRELLGTMSKSKALGGMASTYLELLKNMG